MRYCQSCYSRGSFTFCFFLTVPSVHLCVGGQDLRDKSQIAFKEPEWWRVLVPDSGFVHSVTLNWKKGEMIKYHHKKTAPSLYVLLKEEW